MTWGSHCPQCGHDDCSWVDGPICEGMIGGFDRKARRRERKVAELRRLVLEAAMLGLATAFTFLAVSVGGTEGLLAGLMAWVYTIWHISWWRRLR